MPAPAACCLGRAERCWRKRNVKAAAIGGGDTAASVTMGTRTGPAQRLVLGPQAACPCAACLKGPSLRTISTVSTLTGRAQGESGLHLLLTLSKIPGPSQSLWGSGFPACTVPWMGAGREGRLSRASLSLGPCPCPHRTLGSTSFLRGLELRP